MVEHISCKKCVATNCKGCNVNTLSKMLDSGKFDCIMDGHHSINPAADVVEARHGYWKQNQYCKRIYFCSECGRHIEDGSIHKNPSVHFPYCHCGAKMDGKGEGE